MFADLHLHSCFSDGSFTPEQIAAAAQRHHLATVALTDHDTLEGCPRMERACAAAGLEFIIGVELTADHAGDEAHLLGYFLDPANERLQSELARFQTVRQERIREMVRRLNQLGVPLEAEDVFALAQCRAPGRPHVARALAQRGFCRNVDEAFERYLKLRRPAWVPKCRISTQHAIELIHHAGGLAVLAHPGLNRTDAFIPALAEAGLDGLECLHSRHSVRQRQHYEELAKHLGLLITGGSDCHGDSRSRPLIGTVRLPYACVEQLKQRAAGRRSAQPSEVLAAAH